MSCLKVFLTTLGVFCSLSRQMFCFETEFYGLSSNSLDNLAAVPFIGVPRPITGFQCLYKCTLNRSCQGTFYNSFDQLCMLSDKAYLNSSELQDYSGMKFYRILPLTCSDVPVSVFNGSSLRLIDPDGKATKFAPSIVLCDLSLEPGKAVTVLNHDFEGRTYVNGYEKCGSYKINLTYKVGLEAAKKIVDSSSNCKQYIKWECYHSTMYKVSRFPPCTGWRNRQTEISKYFTGSGSYWKYCDCRQMSRCFHSTGCNCNKNDKIWRYDDGFVTNKNDLPIATFFAGDTGMYEGDQNGEKGYHTIGAVHCW